ncbi:MULTISPECIES: phosphoribosylformylglycinamidine synthase subunit PurS [Salimicrobium]|uniref:Phosphoribosylformylglycinamidine synthase subunit PurS n=3 Tax=Salimicrobium TaxID=351195 RepID=K2H9U4_9BACI|nr:MULTISPECIES: phosphoribosylformylglycinamidine synthase subunit PurS [Salimicrobium]AKG05204.1 phosphoribosylformylglycinamidine synthase subunit PurS [Salimicrobium jeotgali]EKE32415.1 phosphoribosylformylglycinamidine synthase subunit PurS [Salimicrobium jeotgali]MBM7695606.1 phosphoribosylformylglycinamidine synthase [Salimicrobium jeotgali]SDY12160.1 phosphoribosylformylglycinamidine synthase [Salimicrobium album]SIS76062.1 phosphoribosylformylglycinamidine synthase [Salimicrobium sale
MCKVNIYITLKEAVLDPQGKVISQSLKDLEYDGVRDVRTGKYLQVELADRENAEKKIEDMCNRLLANPVIEDYTYTIEEVV